jgi:hypothetical protein
MGDPKLLDKHQLDPSEYRHVLGTWYSNSRENLKLKCMINFILHNALMS